MADLKVQRKRNSKFLLYVFLLFVLFALTYFFLNKDNTTTSDRAPADSVEVSR